ncbi:hypothetical protein quinque_006430 [Culex quinquefasciatus]
MAGEKVDIKTRFFTFVEEIGSYKCKIGNCTSILKGAASSLKRHLVDLHPTVAKEIGINGYKRKEKDVIPDEPRNKKLKTVTLNIDPAEFEQGLIEMVAIKAVPFNFFDSKSYKHTSGLIAKSLDLPTHADAMGLLVSQVAGKIRDLIAEELQDVMFSLKLDGVSRHDRKIIGVNAQFKRAGKTIIRTLSMMEIHEKQTGSNLKMHVTSVLQKFRTKIINVYAVNTDRAPNVLSCSRQLKMEQNLALDQDQPPESSTVPADVSVTSGGDEADNVAGAEDDCDNESSPKDSQNDLEVDEMMTDLSNMFQHGDYACLDVVKCGAHVMNSIFKDALKAVDDTWLADVRHVVKASRRVEYRRLFKMAKIPYPKVDVETRWTSTYSMIDSVLTYKDFFVEIGEQYEALKVSDENWNIMQEFATSFGPINVATIALQSPDIIMGDMYRIIKRCKFDINKLKEKNRFAEGLLGALQNSDDDDNSREAF